MKNVKKKILSSLIVLSIVSSNILSVTEAMTLNDTNKQIYADWRFDKESIKSGSIEDENLIIKDYSGNGNDLEMQTYGDAEDYNKYINFSDETMDESTKGSLVINGDSENKTGADFITVKDAPINSETFKNGYTVEFLYKLPDDWTVADSWMSLLARQGNSKSMVEPELGSMNIAISNCKEIQFIAANKDDNHTMDSAWSVSMDKGGVWYHIVITSDNNNIRAYVNGAEAFRDYTSDEMVGIYADSQDGRFRVGSSYWNGLDKFGIGNYQRIRISEGVLEKSEWLISNPEDYAGEYGNNNNFTMNRHSNYNMVFLPDTQNAIKFRPNIINKSMEWLVENKNNINISSVINLGDIVEDFLLEDQWENALTFNTLAENDIKLLMQPGNHDNPILFDKYFGVDSYYGSLTNDYIKRNSPSGRSGYMIYDGGSYKYMALSIDIHSIDIDLPWVEEVLTKTNMPTIITSHDIQNCSDVSPSSIKLSPNGEKIWNVVKKYNQVFTLIGGHSHGAGHEILINDFGNEVLSVLSDYQFSYNGGNALYKFAEFDELNDKIYMSTFSPYVATLNDEERGFFDVNYLTGEGNYFEFNIDFATRFNSMEKSDNYKIYLEKLKGAILRGEEIVLDNYTEDSAKELKLALEIANNLISNKNSVNDEMLEAISSIDRAIKNLVKISENESSIPEKTPDLPKENEQNNNSNGDEKSINTEEKTYKYKNKLPNTGGTRVVFPLSLGVMIFISGVVIYRKNCM